jgi:cell filamentation protein
MIFDPFGDFETQGYLKNFEAIKDRALIKIIEHTAFQINLETAMIALAATKLIEYKHVLSTHQTLFGDVYPWAGQDRLTTNPNINITKSGFDRLFAYPQNIRRATEYALTQSRDLDLIRQKPGEVLGALAHAHPFLDGNGRTIMVIHTEMMHRAGISIDWLQTEKVAYLTALTAELNIPGQGHLDEYLRPFIRSAIERPQAFSMLKTLKGLGDSPNT